MLQVVLVAALDVRHHARALFEVDDGRDVRHTLAERRQIVPADDRVRVQRRPAAGLLPLDVVAPAVRAERPGVEVGLAAGCASLDEELVVAGRVPVRLRLEVGSRKVEARRVDIDQSFGQSEQAFRDDVALHLAGAAGDREAPVGEEARRPTTPRRHRWPRLARRAAPSPTSCTRWSCSTPSNLRTLDSGPGSAPRMARAPSCASRAPRATAPRRAARRPRRPRPGRRTSTMPSSISTPNPNDEPDPIDTRSFASVVRAARQPSLTAPTTQSSGTNTSDRNTSLNMAKPVSSRSGRMSMPSLVMSTQKQVMPSCFGDGRDRCGRGRCPSPTPWPSSSTPSDR